MLAPTLSYAATSCVWRSTNTPAPVYLVGTIHALSGKDYPLPKAYDQAIRDSKTVLFEQDPKPNPHYRALWERAAKYPNGEEIGRHLHAKTYKLMFAAIRQVSWDWNEIKYYRPWALAALGWGIRGYNDVRGSLGVDNHLEHLAKRFHKQMGGLESDAEHLEVMRGMPDIDAELMLVDSMVHGPKNKAQMEQVTAAWKRGDLGPPTAEVARSRQLNLGAEIRLLDYRNLRWAKRFEPRIKSGESIAVVAGSAHFVGPNNVRELLEKRGYKFEQL
ncbi:MAG: TraB/GumN family protein [Chthoniobacterales bacterium]|nr:TraB/GumN family protein [Chthoniobacterales bacterium]